MIDVDRLNTSLDKYRDFQKDISWIDMDGIPVSVSTPCFDGGYIYRCIGANIQAVPANPNDLIKDFARKADEAAKKMGLRYYVSSGQDYRVYTNKEPPEPLRFRAIGQPSEVY